MMNTLWAVIRDGKIEPLEPVAAADGTRVLVTVFAEDEAAFWTAASQSALDAVWDNPQDDIYAELLER